MTHKLWKLCTTPRWTPPLRWSSCLTTWAPLSWHRVESSGCTANAKWSPARADAAAEKLHCTAWLIGASRVELATTCHVMAKGCPEKIQLSHSSNWRIVKVKVSVLLACDNIAILMLCTLVTQSYVFKRKPDVLGFILINMSVVTSPSIDDVDKAWGYMPLPDVIANHIFSLFQGDIARRGNIWSTTELTYLMLQNACRSTSQAGPFRQISQAPKLPKPTINQTWEASWMCMAAWLCWYLEESQLQLQCWVSESVRLPISDFRRNWQRA